MDSAISEAKTPDSKLHIHTLCSLLEDTFNISRSEVPPVVESYTTKLYELRCDGHFPIHTYLSEEEVQTVRKKLEVWGRYRKADTKPILCVLEEPVLFRKLMEEVDTDIDADAEDCHRQKMKEVLDSLRMRAFLRACKRRVRKLEEKKREKKRMMDKIRVRKEQKRRYRNVLFELVSKHGFTLKRRIVEENLRREKKKKELEKDRIYYI
jgi:hypothetical protein